MAAILDHIHIGCANVYTTAFDLMKATGLGHYDGGFAGNITIGHKAVPLGGKGVYPRDREHRRSVRDSGREQAAVVVHRARWP